MNNIWWLHLGWYEQTLSEPQKLPAQYWRAEMSPKSSTSIGNHFWEISGIFKETYFQYWLLPVLRPGASAPVVAKNESPTFVGIHVTSALQEQLLSCPDVVCYAHASGKKKAHKHKLFCPVGPSFHRSCPRDKPSLSLGQIRWKTGTNPGILLILHSGSPISPGLSLGQTLFVPGTIPGTKGGTESLREKSLCAFFAR